MENDFKDRLGYEGTIAMYILDKNSDVSEEQFSVLMEAATRMYESVENYLLSKYSMGELETALSIMEDYSDKLNALSEMIVEELN